MSAAAAGDASAGASREDAVVDKLGWKLVGGVSAVLAGIAARQAIEKVWVFAMKSDPPKNPEDPDTTWPEAIGWAVLSGVGVGVARLVAMRKAAETWKRATGELPPGLQKAG
jgi:hypothetical protein